MACEAMLPTARTNDALRSHATLVTRGQPVRSASMRTTLYFAFPIEATTSMEPDQPVTFLIVGAGSRGMRYAEFAAANPEMSQNWSVLLSLDRRLERCLQQQHQLQADFVFEDWEQAAAKEKFADAVVISTLDAMHADPAIAFANKGYHILLEKPMAPSL